MSTENDTAVIQRPFWVTALLLGLSAFALVVFVLLGNWQIKRLYWKLDLIAAVDARAFGAPSPLPEQFDPDQHGYLRVAVDGRFLPEHSYLIKAVTDLGPGYWVMQPMETDTGLLWVNRGFVPNGQKSPAGWADAQTPVRGLLRPTEPGGTLLEQNLPDQNRWVSRDVAALSQDADLPEPLPYFIDQDSTDAVGWPRGGLTVIKFTNNHLSYALTWYAMALLFAAALVFVFLNHRKSTR